MAQMAHSELEKGDTKGTWCTCFSSCAGAFPCVTPFLKDACTQNKEESNSSGIGTFVGHIGHATRHEPLKPVTQGGTKSGPSRHHVPRGLPDKPRSSKQKYRLTDKGRAFLQGERNRE